MIDEATRRAEFGALFGIAYLDHALRGPLPARSLARARATLEACTRGALVRAQQTEAIEECRRALARLLNASPAEVAFAQNATGALATVAQGLALGAGDRVVTNGGEFASNVLPWRALESRGVTVEVVPLREDRLELGDVERAIAPPENVAQKGRVVLAVGAVSLATGERRDLAALGRLARAAGAFFVVDAAQALGAVAIDPRALGIDALAASSRKWLLGPPEAGILWLRRERLEELTVAAGGALSQEGGRWRADARRFEGGALGAPVLAGLAASVEWLCELGPARVEEAVLSNADLCRRGAIAAGLEVLSPAGSPIVRVRPRRPVTEESLAARGIVARVEASGVVRLSPHFWTPPGDVDRAIRALHGDG